MRPNTVLELFRRGTCARAAWISCDSAYVAELAGSAGFDAVVLDLQHGLAGHREMVAMLQALSHTPAVPMVRTSQNNLGEINRALDAGALGVICPLIDNADQARDFGRACRYPPRGGRSFGPARGLLHYGPTYAQHANDQVLALAMVETRAGLEALDAIVAVDEIDGVFVGPSDLGLSLGLGFGARHTEPALADALVRVLAACRAAGKYAGVWCATTEMACEMRAAGWSMVVPGHDAMWLKAEMARCLAALDAPQEKS